MVTSEPLKPSKIGQNKKPSNFSVTGFRTPCGERGIRTPGGLTLNSFQDCRNRPLCHFSGGKSNTFFNYRAKHPFYI
jgi:hypothetical protein